MYYGRSNEVQIETRLESPVQDWLVIASQKQPAWEETLATVRRLAEQQPQNFALQITAALAALGGNQPDAEQVVARLVKLVEATPLSAPPQRGAATDAASVRAIAAQRWAAKRQMALWLVARECFARPALQDAAERLTRRALDAARWQTDDNLLRAILRERGQIAGEQQRWEVAEKNWLELLRVIHASPESVADEPAAAQTLTLTLQQIQLTQKLALLFARNGNDRAAMNLVRTALQNGPPGQEISSHNPYQSHHFHGGGSWFDPDSALREVPQQLAELDRLRRKRGRPAGEMVQLLTEIVLPEKRPGELFPYPHSAGRHSDNPDGQVARLLVRSAVESGQAAELRQRIQQRLEQPLAELPARALLVDLGIASGDTALAAEQILALQQRLAVDSLAETAQLASDVALVAIEVPALETSATELLELSIANVSTKGNTAGEWRRQLIRAHFKQGRADEARQQLLEYRKILSAGYTQQRYSYAQQQHNLELRKLAHEFLAADMWEDAWSAFGESVDAAVTERDGPALGEDREAAEILARVAAHSAAQRFEILLPWTLPTENRKSLRLMSTLAIAEPSPPTAVAVPQSKAWLVSSAEMLVSAARETGRLDELAATIEPLAEQKLEGARALWLLVQIARGRGADVEPELRQLQTTRQKQLPPGRRRQHFVPTTDYLLARACIHNARLRELGQQWCRSLSAPAQRQADSQVVFHVNQELIASLFAGENEATVRRALTPDWRLWRVDQMAGLRNDTSKKQVFWLAANDRIVHVAGDSWGDFLRFAYPLTGTFEFSAEIFSPVEDDQLGFIALRYDNGNRLHWNRRDANGVAIPAPEKFGRSEQFNDLKLQVEPGHIRCFVNGLLVSDEVSDQVIAPWLELRVTGTAPVLFRNLRLTGSPIIPRELPLLPDDHVGNWYASDYDEKVQSNRPASQSGESPPRAKFRQETKSTKAESIDWLARDGELIGRMTTDEGSEQSAPRPSRLALLRSLNDGESIRYEFFFSPSDGVTPHLVHPAIGREVFQLETNGVRLLSMPEIVKPARGRAAPREVVKKEPEKSELIRLAGQSRLPLKPNDWNAVRLSIVGEQVRLELNGELILQRDLATSDRVFSFFHDQHQSTARLRNVTLTGNWPQRLTAEEMAHSTATRTSASESERRVVETLLKEFFPQP